MKKEKESNFVEEKSDRQCPIQVVKVNIRSDVRWIVVSLDVMCVGTLK